MRKLTNEEIRELTNVEGIEKEAVENYLSNLPSNLLDALDILIQNAKKSRWKKATILACMNGLWLSAGLPAQDDIAGC